MRPAAVLLLAVFAFALVAAQKDNPPDVAGTWTETVCNSIPNLDSIYRNRTWNYNTFNYELGGSTFTGHVDGFSDGGCESPVFRLSQVGFYRITDLRSIYLERFWTIDYLYEQKLLRVFTQGFVNYLNSEYFGNCNFERPWSVGEEQDVTFVDCPQLMLTSIAECPVEYSIVRQVSNVLFVGNVFAAGYPTAFSLACSGFERYRTFDPYSLTFLHPVQQDPHTFALGDFISDPFIFVGSASSVTWSSLVAVAVAVVSLLFL